jgi:hypothetical protein
VAGPRRVGRGARRHVRRSLAWRSLSRRLDLERECIGDGARHAARPCRLDLADSDILLRALGTLVPGTFRHQDLVSSASEVARETKCRA